MREEAMEAWDLYESKFRVDQVYTDGGKLRELILWKNHQLETRKCELLPQTCEILQAFAAEGSCLKGEVSIPLLPNKLTSILLR